jgi:hypothetical protein
LNAKNKPGRLRLSIQGDDVATNGLPRVLEITQKMIATISCMSMSCCVK